MTDTLKLDSYRSEAIRRLSAGFAEDFAEFCAGHEDLHEMVMNLASEFVERQIPITDEDASADLAFELLTAVTIRKV